MLKKFSGNSKRILLKSEKMNPNVGSITSSRVSLVKCPVYELPALKNSISAAIGLLGGLERFVRLGARVLLKPNVMMPKPYGFAANTHPLFLQAVIELFKEKGAAVTVGESSAGSQAGITFTKKALQVSGIEDVAKQCGVRLVNFDLDQAVWTNIPNPLVPSIPLAKSVLEADLVVSLPKFKTHTYRNIITGAVKNIYGTIPGQIKADYHRLAPRPEDFYTIVRDIYRAVHPGLVIFDAVEGMEGNGPSAGTPRHLGLIIASADGVAADAVAAELMHVPSTRVLTTRLAAEAGLGRGRMEEIEVLGEKLESVAPRHFKLPASTVINPYLYRFILAMTETIPVIDPGKCTLCKTCADSCPMQVIEEKDKKMVINRKDCIRCFCCSEVCPQQAMKPKRKNPLGSFLSKLMLSRW
jgi:uncharacterized protein (DUF362 family)/NAD-dependent dihydropyrimidine dehydrogenase PreA subunit